ncbi:MAG: winged helix-turn-helix transcriptional regulator, partial [Tissierellia bacterium]|nr:winged helix-turn-helix transcriptional regulator [Tissierellia bacterium]
LFIENYPKVITREELLRSLWDDEIFVEENTLNVNITRIRKRLLEVEAEFFIEAVRGLGYRLVEGE